MKYSRRSALSILTGTAVSGIFMPHISRAATGEKIKIGALCELSGPASTIGTQQAYGIQLAVEEINRNGGILGGGPGIDGRQIELILEDTETKAAAGLSKAKKLVERDGVQALTGVIFSSISLAIQEYVNKEAKIPFINSGSSSTAISEPPACGKFTFQAQPSARAYVMPALDAAQKHGKRWFFIADDYPWGHQSVELMKKAIQRGSALEVVGQEFAPLGTTNYAPYVTKLMAAKPDVVGIVVFGAGYARVLLQMQQMGLSAHRHHYFWSQVDAVAAGDAAVGMTAAETYTFNNPTVPRAAKFAQAFKAAKGAYPDPVAARGYTGVELLALAIKSAGGTDPNKLVRALEGIDHKESVIGPLKFRECDHVAEAPVFLIEARKDPEYKLNPVFVANVKEPNYLVTPCGSTGCESLVRG